MKMEKENNKLINIIQKLKKDGNRTGIQQAIVSTCETFSCIRMALYEYRIYQDNFEIKYEWAEKGYVFEKTLNDILKDEIVSCSHAGNNNVTQK